MRLTWFLIVCHHRILAQGSLEILNKILLEHTQGVRKFSVKKMLRALFGYIKAQIHLSNQERDILLRCQCGVVLGHGWPPYDLTIGLAILLEKNKSLSPIIRFSKIKKRFHALMEQTPPPTDPLDEA